MTASTWGNPNAAKRVLLIHGILSSSHSWHHIGLEFASRGYFVVAPDLLGHGNAGCGSDYTLAGLVDGLRPYLAPSTPGSNDHPYDIVIGHSLGGVVTSALLPLLKSTRPVQVVLSDPPLELTPESLAFLRQTFCDLIRNLKSPAREVLQQEYPSHTRKGAIFAWLGRRLCNVTVVEAIADQNKPWSFSHLLLAVPENVNVAALVADPTKDALLKEEHVRGFPRVTSKVIWGSPHHIPADAPQVIIEAALRRTESQN